MRKIDKSNFPATVFVTSLAEEVNNDAKGYHPDYSEGKFRTTHYNSVFFGLLICQKGLCAYTESLLCNDDNLLDPVKSYEHGIYILANKTSGTDSDIEHYDSSLKVNWGWKLDNLFLCRVFINRDIKKSKPTLTDLKPDLPDYSPSKYLRYNFGTHRFVANHDIEDDVIKNAINYQLDFVLGINSDQIISERRNMLNVYKKYIQEGLRTYEYIRDNELTQFFTAYEMSFIDLTT